MKQLFKFLAGLLLFFVPVLLVLSPLLASGEIYNGETVMNLQVRGKASVLYGPAYTEQQYRYYKASAAKAENPQVMILGDSRSLQIRSFFFNAGISFYNAGFVTPSSADMAFFLEEVDVSGLEVLLVNVSQCHFNLNYTEVGWPVNDYFTSRASGNGSTPLAAASNIIRDIKMGEFGFWQLFSNPAQIGLNAKLKENGMLNDGSFYYGDAYQRAAEGEDAIVRIEETIQRIEGGYARFEYGDEANERALYFTQYLLDYCAQNNVKLIAFTSPYAPSANEAMARHKADYGYMPDMMQKLEELFKGYDAEFYDYTDVSALGITDDYFIDGFHAADTVYVEMFCDMIEKGSYLGELCDINNLKNISEQRFDNLRLYEKWQKYNELTKNR